MNHLFHQGSTPLHVAVVNQQVATFDHLLTLQDTKLNARDGFNSGTPLYQAASLDNSYFAIKLIDSGADVHLLTYGGCSPLVKALNGFPHHCCEIAKKLVNAGSDINIDACTDGRTPLMAACFGNCHECIYMLLYLNADASAVDCNGEPALEKAVCYYPGNENDSNRDLLQTLFDYTFDEFNTTCNLSLLCDCMASQSQFSFTLVTNHVTEVYCNEFGLGRFCDGLFRFWREAEVIMNKYPNVIREIVLHKPRSFFNYLPEYSKYNPRDKKEFVSYFCKFASLLDEIWQDGSVILPPIPYLNSKLDTSRSKLRRDYCRPLCDDEANMVLHLASLGYPVTFRDVAEFYATFGSCELFTTLLHIADMPSTVSVQDRLEFRVAFMVDINFSIEKMLSHDFTAVFDESILNFFAGQILNELLQKHDVSFSCPDVSSLLELSRNSFRKYLITKFNVRTLGMFLARVKMLEIGDVFKDIICCRKAIYCNV